MRFPGNAVVLVFVLVAAYFAAWTASYALVTCYGYGLDFAYYFEYLRLAWTFRGGELPTIIWYFSIVAFVPSAGLAVLLLRRRRRHRNAA